MRVGGRKFRTIHRLVAVAFLPNPDNKPEVNHKDGNKRNNRADNLEWVTKDENVQHATENGLYVGRPGEKHHNAKLTVEDVKKIRKLYSTGRFYMKELAEWFGICTPHVSDIVNGKRWGDR